MHQRLVKLVANISSLVFFITLTSNCRTPHNQKASFIEEAPQPNSENNEKNTNDGPNNLETEKASSKTQRELVFALVNIDEKSSGDMNFDKVVSAFNKLNDKDFSIITAMLAQSQNIDGNSNGLNLVNFGEVLASKSLRDLAGSLTGAFGLGFKALGVVGKFKKAGQISTAIAKHDSPAAVCHSLELCFMFVPLPGASAVLNEVSRPFREALTDHTIPQDIPAKIVSRGLSLVPVSMPTLGTQVMESGLAASRKLGIMLREQAIKGTLVLRMFTIPAA